MKRKLVRRRRPPRPDSRREVERLVDEAGASLLDLIDNTLNRGVRLEGELILGLADVDLVYLRLSALLSAADRAGAPRRRR